MNKTLKILSTSFLAGTLLVSSTLPAAASESNNPSLTGDVVQSNTDLTQDIINIMDEYVTLSEEGTYVIDPSIDLASILSPTDLDLVLKSIQDANDALEEINNRSRFALGSVSTAEDAVVLTVYDNQLKGKTGGYQLAAYTSGKTAIYTYWWGYKVYLSKYVVNVAGGASVGAATYLMGRLGVTSVPLGLAIAAGLGGLGVVATTIPYGVEMRINKTFVSNTVRYIPTQVKYQTK